ncbi:MAG: hypothetical protein AAF355_11375 [Myxococcota bacterium]
MGTQRFFGVFGQCTGAVLAGWKLGEVGLEHSELERAWLTGAEQVKLARAEHSELEQARLTRQHLEHAKLKQT